MDFKPDRNILILNYAITFGIVGLILFLSSRPGKVARYYYSPEFTSHASYGSGASSCATCHVKPFSGVEEKNCSVSGCHTSFGPGQASSSERLTLKQNEFGKPRPQFGPLLAFHDKVQGQISCEACHPSHRLPQKGQFNHATILAAMQAEGGVPAEAAARSKKQAGIFHRNAEQLIGKVSCQTCHIKPSADPSVTAAVGEVIPAAQAHGTPAPASLPGGLASTETSPTAAVAPGIDQPATSTQQVVTGDISKWAVLQTPVPSPSPGPAEENSSGLTNLFKAVEAQPVTTGVVTTERARNDDGSAELPH